MDAPALTRRERSVEDAMNKDELKFPLPVMSRAEIEDMRRAAQEDTERRMRELVDADAKAVGSGYMYPEPLVEFVDALAQAADKLEWSSYDTWEGVTAFQVQVDATRVVVRHERGEKTQTKPGRSLYMLVNGEVIDDGVWLWPIYEAAKRSVLERATAYLRELEYEHEAPVGYQMKSVAESGVVETLVADFMGNVRMAISRWKLAPCAPEYGDDEIGHKLSGLAHSILCIIDGVAGSPPLTLIAETSTGRIALNESRMLHDELYPLEREKADPSDE